MRHDWSKEGSLVFVLRNGGSEPTLMIDARRDAADEIERLQKELGLRDAALAECHKEIFKLRDTLLMHGHVNQ